MEIIRMLTNEEMKEAVRLSDATFRDAEQPSMGGAFPFIFAESMMHLSFGAFEDGKLLSFMGLVPWTIRIGEARLQVFSLGSVCTDPDARGKGIASRILQEIYGYIRQAGASLLLVSGGRSLYTRSGCVPFGRVRRYLLDRPAANLILSAGQSSAIQMREKAPNDIFQLHNLASQRSIRYEHGITELSMLIQSEALASCIKMKHRVLVATSEGAVTAFAVIGVPLDPTRRGRVFEFAGDEQSVARLAAYAVQKYELAGLEFPVPWHNTQLQNSLSGVQSSEENQDGTIRIVDGQALISQLQPWFDAQPTSSAAPIRIEEKEDGSWLLENGSNCLKLSANEIVRFIFDCATAQDSKIGGADAVQGLPVPFPYTAGLAYI